MLNTGYVLDGKYEIIKVLGSGGMGTVYLCRNNRLGNHWAIKEVLSEWKEKIDFLAEPNILKDLSHPGIPRIIDIFYQEDNLYMVEDYIDGENLKELVEKSGTLSSEKIKTIALQLCKILDYLHSFSPPIIYRDLKPSNIMLKNDGNIVLVDFGIARTYKEYKDNDTLVLGSKGFMAPEQLYNVQSNIQTDIYSFGATLFFLATGKTFVTSNDTKILYEEVNNLDEKLLKVIDKATEAIPEIRFKNIAEIKKMLLEDKDDYIRTKFIPVEDIKDKTIFKTQFMSAKKTKKKLPYLAAGILLLIAILIAIYFLLSIGNGKKLPSNNSNKKADTSQVKNPQTAKESIDKDIIIRGILYKNNPIITNDNNNAANYNGKGKGKNKNKDNSEENNFNLLFNLNPKASISNSKISITVNSFQYINSVSILDITIENKANETIYMDLNKTLLLNGNNISFSPDISNSNNILVPQNTSQNIKLYFDEFDFEGNFYYFNTNINYGNTYKDIHLFVDIK